MSHDMEAIAEQLRSAGYRVTPQRRLILNAVCELSGHVTPEEVYAHVNAIAPGVNQATVYRGLHFLSEQGVITVAQIAGGRFGYELAGPERHHHLVCRECGGSVEIPHRMLRRFYETVEGEYGFATDMDHLSFVGLCAGCRERVP